MQQAETDFILNKIWTTAGPNDTLWHFQTRAAIKQITDTNQPDPHCGIWWQ